MLFENELIQIGVKSEFRQNLARIGLFYGNKTQNPLHRLYFRFWTIINIKKNQLTIKFFSLKLDLIWDNSTKLNVQMKPVEPLLEAGAQVQQLLTAECIDDYPGMINFSKHNAIS